MYHKIDYLVYQYIHQESDQYMNYLKEINDDVFIKPFTLRFEYASNLLLKLMEHHAVTLQKEEELYRCSIDDNYLGESLYPSMAICLAILDLHGVKEQYEEEARQFIEKDIEGVKKRREELEARLKGETK